MNNCFIHNKKGYKVRVFSREAISESEKGFSERTVTLKGKKVQNLNMEGVFVVLTPKDGENVNLTRAHKIFFFLYLKWNWPDG